ncbi:heavy-metal-associated domain-containing protein [Chitinimonas taiwanensis]|uniref:Copper chaperone n=1 Tax=Chitinimonas taiwanensis DSM 18899 TaxID=1121279 RepID=A0A1K2HJC6_9NEIS|nr:copper chaperone [Chitinimonas taiwanensis DSM 18899]
MEQVFQIEGMSCGGCVASVERALRAQAGVQQVAVSLADKQAKVAFDAAQMDATRLRAAIEAAGFEVVG